MLLNYIELTKYLFICIFRLSFCRI